MRRKEKEIKEPDEIVAILNSGVRTLEPTKARVARSRTVEIPAPTAASVKATSTASITVNNEADNRLKMPV